MQCVGICVGICVHMCAHECGLVYCGAFKWDLLAAHNAEHRSKFCYICFASLHKAAPQ